MIGAKAGRRGGETRGDDEEDDAMKSVIIGHSYFSNEWRLILNGSVLEIDRETAIWMRDELSRQLGEDPAYRSLQEHRNRLIEENRRLQHANAALRGVAAKRRKS